MADISVNIKGLNELLKRVENKSVALKEEVDGEIEKFCGDVTLKAKQRAPIDTGSLRQGTDFIRKGDLDFVIFSRVKYAPWIEFGTGGLVKVPAELQSYAMQFKGKGVKKINLKPRPFFFNSFFEERPKLMVRLKRLINESK